MPFGSSSEFDVAIRLGCKFGIAMRRGCNFERFIELVRLAAYISRRISLLQRVLSSHERRTTRSYMVHSSNERAEWETHHTPRRQGPTPKRQPTSLENHTPSSPAKCESVPDPTVRKKVWCQPYPHARRHRNDADRETRDDDKTEKTMEGESRGRSK
ncbi:hypothetical protein K474DRAFT_1674095 [Panus rudis PR-1116 ss-1]|nr:hypothetical protein K474DRAFT_1674095 [Panus rudis PR-1116 ss-1]